MTIDFQHCTLLNIQPCCMDKSIMQLSTHQAQQFPKISPIVEAQMRNHIWFRIYRTTTSQAPRSKAQNPMLPKIAGKTARE